MGRFLSLISISLLLFVTVLSSGCAKSEDKPIEDVVDDGGKLYTNASCEFKADEGLPAPSGPLVQQLSTSYFGKKISKNLLDSVTNVSATELVRFASLTGVDFRSVIRYKADSCEMGHFIPAADSIQNEYFNKIEGNILGVYFSPKAEQLRMKNERAVILIRRDTNKWVMLHEYSHHLYAKEVQSEISDDDLKDKITLAARKYSSNKDKVVDESKKENVTDMVLGAYELGQHFPELILRFPLEEVAIESELYRYYVAGHMKATPSNQSINGAGYIISSAKRAKEWIAEISHILQLAIVYHGIYKAESKVGEDKIEEMRKKINLLKTWNDDLDPIVRAAQQRKIAAGYRALGQVDLAQQGFVSPRTGDDIHVGCSHSHGADEIMNLLRKNRK